MKRLLLIPFLFSLLSLLPFSCTDLEVPNDNAINTKKVSADLNDIINIAESSFRTFHNTIQEYISLALPLAVMADHLTMSWGTTRDYSCEPRDSQRNSYPNTKMYAYSFQLIGQWEGAYSAIDKANLVLSCMDLESDFNLEDNQKALLEAFSYFVSGVSHGYLGLIFDKAIVIKHTDDLTNPVLSSWEVVIDEALKFLDKAIEIADANSFEIPLNWVGGLEMTNIELAQLANAYSARILMSSSRTKAHNREIDWDKVREYAQNGPRWDFTPIIGDAYGWSDDYWVYGRYPGWARADMRIINLMDHDYPSRWPRDNISWNTPDGNDPGEADPDDARLTTDFEYLETNSFRPERGYYHFSHYRHSRYDYLSNEAWYGNGAKPSFLAWEVRLIEAEALFRTGSFDGALAILNDPTGPRKLRGQLPDVQATDDVLRYILDEKEIECFLTGAGISYFDMRRTDRLQPATLLHFPVPASELEIMRFEHYTIRWHANGTDGSYGDWTGWDE
ncbi:RagB/SusD family nutrient uptake outer membrane protein [Bacteroidota bacterium]